MESLANLIPKSKVIQTLRFKQRWLNQCWTHVSNKLLRDTSISATARLVYMLLMSRAFQKDFSYPGRETLSKETGISVRQTERYIKELKDNSWIEIKRRGLNKTNLYFLKRF